MKTVGLLFLALTWFAYADPVYGQDSLRVLTLHQALDLAARHNIAIRQGRTGLLADSQKIKLEQTGNYPKLRFNTVVSRASTPTQLPLLFQNQTVLAEIGTKNSFNAEIQASQKLFDFGRTSHRVKAAEFGLEADQAGYSDQIKQIRMEVRLYFYSILYYQKMDSIYGTIIPLSDELRKISEAQLNSGISIPVDVLQTESNTEQVRVRQAEVVNSLQQCRNQLAELVGLSPDGLTLRGELPSLRMTADPLTLHDSLYSLAVKNRGIFRQLDLKSRQERELSEAAKSTFRPTISLFGTASYYGPRISALYPELQGLKTYNLKAGVTISLDLFDGHYSSLTARQLRTQSRQTDLERDSKAAILSTRIRNLLGDLSSLVLLKKSNQLTLHLMRTNAGLALTNFEKGAGSRLAYIQAQIPAADAAVTLERTRFNILQKILQLQGEVGSEDILLSDQGR